MAANYFRTALGRIGLNQEARTVLTDPNGEDITLESLGLFDDDAIKNLCQSLRKPGGTIQGQLPPGAAAGAVPPMIPNPGVTVSARAEANLKVVAYMVRHFQRTSRTLDPAFVDANSVMRYTQYKKAEKEHKEPDTALKLDKVDKVWDFIDEWPDHLALYDGQDDRPLDYIIRPDIVVPAAANDPTYGMPDCRYGSMRSEIASRSSHDGPIIKSIMQGCLIY
jgi:hypothetical protein